MHSAIFSVRYLCCRVLKLFRLWSRNRYKYCTICHLGLSYFNYPLFKLFTFAKICFIVSSLLSVKLKGDLVKRWK